MKTDQHQIADWKRILGVAALVIAASSCILGFTYLLEKIQTWFQNPYSPVIFLILVVVVLLIFDNVYQRGWTKSLLIVLIVVMIIVLLGTLIKLGLEADGSLRFSPLELVFLISSAGAFGGLMYGMRGGRWVWPSTKAGVTNVGFLRHLLIGLAGGWVIFIVLPGNYDLNESTGQMEFVRFVGLAFIGGFGGYALVERVLEKTLKEVEEKFLEIEEQEKRDAETLEEVGQYLDKKSSSTYSYKQQLEKRIQESSLKIMLAILAKVQEKRQKSWTDNIGVFINRLDVVKSEEEKKGYLEKLKKGEQYYQAFVDRILPILETISRKEEANNYHRVFGQLGFAYKDNSSPDYGLALKLLSKAIQIRDNTGEQAGEMYEFNRAICLVMLDKTDDQRISSDIKEFAMTGEGKRILPDLLMGTRKDLGQNIRTTRQDLALQKWLVAHPADKYSLINQLELIEDQDDDILEEGSG